MYLLLEDDERDRREDDQREGDDDLDHRGVEVRDAHEASDVEERIEVLLIAKGRQRMEVKASAAGAVGKGDGCKGGRVQWNGVGAHDGSNIRMMVGPGH